MTPALWRSLATIALLVVCWQAPVLAQQAAKATLTGLITDQNGAAVPGVKVTVTLESAGIKRETVSNGEGLYVLTDLAPGEYELRVEAEGFTTKVTKAPITLNVGQSVTLNVSLEVGAIEIVIDNFGHGRKLIDNTASLVEGVVENREVESLPLNGRNFLELALLIPGNAPAPNFDPTKTNTFVISSAGQLGRGGNVMIDGADNNDDVVGGAVQNISQDAIAEFQIATNRYSAQMGRSASSVVNVVTKSGGNELHGSGSIYFRHRELQALPATFDRSLGQTPPFDRQQYSFALGGPIKKERAWFFGSFE
ncbi:MAG TPA: carboxypeptidase regulatory-like domain-containing protein, partial [Pyrinomonadaceae bacterium]|nr:carboxypeptidase regulatory-like domain-containing protein [Pyrinomonadaceae bacterium]